MGSNEQVLATLGLLMGASWTAGLNLYATLAVLGLMHKFIPGFQLPTNLEVLGSWYVIAPSLVMYLVEFVADKIPAFDTAWDSIHTFIRIPAGALIAAAAVGKVPIDIQIGAAALGGTLALGSHAAKATTRLAGHSSGTSFFVTPVASIMEDGIVVGTLAALAASPILVIIAVLLMIVAAGAIIWGFWSCARKVFRAMLTMRRLPREPLAAKL